MFNRNRKTINTGNSIVRKDLNKWKFSKNKNKKLQPEDYWRQIQDDAFLRDISQTQAAKEFFQSDQFKGLRKEMKEEVHLYITKNIDQDNNQSINQKGKNNNFFIKKLLIEFEKKIFPYNQDTVRGIQYVGSLDPKEIMKQTFSRLCNSLTMDRLSMNHDSLAN